MEKISVLILSFNSERTIERALRSVVGFDEVLIVDSGSKDKTESIVKRYSNISGGPSVRWIVHPFAGFSEQRNFAIQEASFDWCLFVDSDEEVSDELREILYNTLSSYPLCPLYPLYRIFRTEYLLGEEIRTGLGRSGYQERFFNRQHVRYNGEIHEYPLIDGQKPGLDSPEVCNLTSKARLNHDPGNSISMTVEKLGKYSILKAKEKILIGQTTNLFIIFFTFPMIFIKIYLISWREGRRGVAAAALEAIHRTLVRLIIYEEVILRSKSDTICRKD